MSSWTSGSAEPLTAEEHAHRASIHAQFGNNDAAMSHALASIALSLNSDSGPPVWPVEDEE